MGNIYVPIRASPAYEIASDLNFFPFPPFSPLSWVQLSWWRWEDDQVLYFNILDLNDRCVGLFRAPVSGWMTSG